MPTSLKLKNIVLVGNFVPSSFDKYFFIKNNILEETDFQPNSYVLNSNLVQINHKRFQIVIAVSQMVITSILTDDLDEINEILIKFLKADINQNITAVGINFHWIVSDSSRKIEELSKEYFYNDRIQLLDKYFKNDDTKYGLYVSGNYKDSRLKLDIKPVSIQELSNKMPPEKLDVLLFIFNFHFESVGSSETLNVMNIINDYKIYKERSIEIIKNYE